LNSLLGQTVLDHSYVKNAVSQIPEEIAQLEHSPSGILLRIYTTEPSIHIYTGDGLQQPFQARAGVALETQHFPNSPHCPQFPNTVLKKGETFRSQTVYEFSLKPE
jgi:aldose 1-epimerase